MSAVLVHEINEKIDQAVEDASDEDVPKTLARQVKARLKKDPTLAWDEALTEIVEKRRR